MNQSDCSGKTLKTWPVFVDHYTDKSILRQWLSAGYIDKGLFYHTDAGTPQGGIISPTLMLFTLAGLERHIKQAAPKKAEKVNFICCFQGKSHIDGVTISEYQTQLLAIPIKRHTKIRCEATSYDPEFTSYWRSRKENRDKSRNSWHMLPETAL